RAGADRIVAHVGARVLGDLADRVGLVAGLSAALAPLKQRRRGHDRGQVVTQLAVAMADGATTLSDLAVLRHQPDLFGAVASTATVWRTLTALTAEPLTRIAAARAAARRRVWAAGVDPGFYVIDIDGTLVTAHSDKEGAASTSKRGYGFYPLVATLDATGEPLVALLRPGNAGSGTAADPIAVRDAALAQLPIDPRAQPVIVRTDSAGFPMPFSTMAPTGTSGSSSAIPFRWRSRPPSSATGGCGGNPLSRSTEPRSGTWGKWPRSPRKGSERVAPGSRLIVRRELPHRGAQLTFTDVHGYRYPLCLTNLPDADLPYLEALYRGWGRCEQTIRDLKATGLAHLPSADFAINQAWLTAVLLAGDLLAWFRCHHVALT
ncbi:MAG: IS1380 family transposase, partial [Clostridia bacterium]